MYYLMLGKKADNSLLTWSSALPDWTGDFAPESDLTQISVVSYFPDGYFQGGGGGGGVSTHGQLFGLSADDHTQYLLVNGTRAMTGDLQMGAFNITTSGLVDGVDVSGHASRHISGGADPIDGYQLAVVYSPTNYIQPTSNILGQHLRRIDDALSNSGSGDFLANGTVAMTGDFNAGGNNIINVNLVDGYDIPTLATSITSISNLLNDHSSRHEFGGADEIDGYQLKVAYTPSYYTPPTNDKLGEHLRRIDDTLGTFGSGTGDFLANGTVAMTGNFNAGGNNIINVNLVDGYDIPTLAFSITSISNLLNDHSSRHENGGADEINVAGLSGLLADAQTPLSHATSHVSGGTDAIDGYQIGIVYTPINYVAPSSNILGQHIRRIDNKLGTLSPVFSQVQTAITVSSNAQTAFTLPSSPLEASAVIMFAGGLKQIYGVDYTVSGTSVTYAGSVTLEIGDIVEFWYLA